MQDNLSYSQEVKFSEEIVQFIDEMDSFFIPTVSSQVSLDEFVNKVLKHGFVLSCRNQSGFILGLLLLYANNLESKESYISYIAVNERNGGIGQKLLQMAELVSRNQGMEKMTVRTNGSNQKAINFYEKNMYELVGREQDRGRMAALFEKSL